MHCLVKHHNASPAGRLGLVHRGIRVANHVARALVFKLIGYKPDTGVGHDQMIADVMWFGKGVQQLTRFEVGIRQLRQAPKEDDKLVAATTRNGVRLAKLTTEDLLILQSDQANE